MRRAIALAMVIGLLAIPLPQAAASQTREQWSTFSRLTKNVTLPAGTDLGISAGVSVFFDAPWGGPVKGMVNLTVQGGVEICGTSELPVVLEAGYKDVFWQGAPAAFVIEGNGRPGQFDIRNATFSNITVFLNGTSGRLDNCTFFNCGVYAGNSPARFVSCTFLASAAVVWNTEQDNRTFIEGCTFLGAEMQYDDSPFLPHEAIGVFGYATIAGCNVSYYQTGVLSVDGVPLVRDCTIGRCLMGLYLAGGEPEDLAAVENCTVEYCAEVGMLLESNVAVHGCTVRYSAAGLYFEGSPTGRKLNWTVSSGRIFGNTGFGVDCLYQEPSLADCVFDDGAGTHNTLGRLRYTVPFRLIVRDPGQNPIETYWYNVTSADGNTTSQKRYPNGYYSNLLAEYTVDNSGARVEKFPYTIRVDHDGIFCQTTVQKGTTNITIILLTLSDLVPYDAAVEPSAPAAGSWASLSTRVKNAGVTITGRASVLFQVDGYIVDIVDIGPISPGASVFVRALDWKSKSGTHRVTVSVDWQSSVAENDESNNNLTADFTAGPPVTPPAKPPDSVTVGAILALVIIVAAVIGLYARRRKGAA